MMKGRRDRIHRAADDGSSASPGCKGAGLLPLLVVLALSVAPRPAWAGCKVQALEIPVRMVGSRPIVTVGLNGTEVPMLLDSGAYFSVLTESTASQLNLPRRNLPFGMRIEGYTGPLDASLTRVSKVQFNGAEIPNLEFIVGGNELGAGIMGVLGRNFLSIADAEYDLAHGIMRLVFPKGDCDNVNFAYWAGDAPINVVPLDTSLRHEDTTIRVVARINGVEIHAVLDTGAGRTSVKSRVARRAGIHESDMRPTDRVGGAGEGLARSWVARVASFELGGEKIANNQLDVDDVDNIGDDMLLGIDYFLSHRIYVSRLQGKLYATWNGGPVFARNRQGADDDARYAAKPESVAPDDADGLARRGEAAAARGDFTRAVEDLDRACALAPQTAWYFLARARVLVAMKQPAKALHDLDQALQLDPSLHNARADRAILRARVGERQGALEDLQALDTVLPPSSQLRAGMAEVYARLDLAPEALHQWDLWMPSHRSDVSVAHVLNERCWLRARLKFDLPHALEDCKEAVKKDGENANFYDSLGWTYLRLEDSARAIKAFDGAITLRAASPWSYYGRGLAHRRLGDVEGAERDLLEARKLMPGIADDVRKAGFDAAEGSAATLPAVSGAGS